MDYAALFAAGVAGLVIGGGIGYIVLRKARRQSALWQIKHAISSIEHDALAHCLRNLRSNCFLTDTDGVRRRYDKVSRAVRERAEGSN